MAVRNRIRELSVLPARFNIMLEQALVSVKDLNEKDLQDLCTVACVVSGATWQHWQSWRLPQDNRPEHEWIVFANIMRIAEKEKLSIPERRIATAFCFVHDTCFIKRIMENDIIKLKNMGLVKEAEELERMKKDQRSLHMKGGASNARFLLSGLKNPDSPATSLLDPETEIEPCVDIVAKHDLWKVRPPQPPLTSQILAVACLEADALWPLHPIGVLADLERRGEKGEDKEEMFHPSLWHEQLEQSRKTLLEFRVDWEKDAHIPKEDFKDSESIFRTDEGFQQYRSWLKFWNLSQ